MLTAVSCLAAGFGKANELSRKKDELTGIIDLLEELGRMISYCESTVASIIEQYCEAQSLLFAEKFAFYIKYEDFPDAWRHAFLESGSSLSKPEAQMFLSLGEKLGTSDVVSQNKLIGYAVDYFRKALEKAEKNERENKRLYIVTGVAAALTAAILMI